MRDILKGSKIKKKTPPSNRFYASSYSGFDLEKAPRPLKVGERINTQGSRKMKELLKAEDYDTIVEMGKDQYKAGADILDVCSVLTERSTEKRDSVILVRDLAESVGIPLMIDSTDPEVIRASLEYYPGTAFINSANLEDGGEKARVIFTLAKEHGSFIVNLVIDEKGMGKEVNRKIKIAERLYRTAVNEYGIEPRRMIFDMLTFTLGTGEDEYADSAVKTYEAIKKMKKRYPDVMTVLGVSNVSFGLPRDARRVLNMVYLEHALRAGLDLAIVNPNEFLSYKDIPEEERKIAEDLIFRRGDEPLKKLIEHFGKGAGLKGPAADAGRKISGLTIEEKLKNCITDRDKSGIIPVIDEAMKTMKPEVIINEVLMDAMRTVGEKLDKGEIVLPYVLQSAEVMRKAIEYLEKFMFGHGVKKQGKVLLATVHGDVHDIGKNLVGMLLKNNGFTVIDLGKQVTIEKIIQEAGKHKVDAIGLSALLVSTARYMKTCVQAMHDAGMDYPVLIGGAPTNKEFAKGISVLKDKSVYKGGVFYSRDAFTGLKIMQVLTDEDRRRKAMDEYHGQFTGEHDVPGKEEAVRGSVAVKEVSSEDIPAAPFYGIRPLVNIPADEVFKYLDTGILFNIAWGAGIKDPREKARLIEAEYTPMFKELKEEAIRKGWLDLKAVYGYFRCRAEGKALVIFDGKGEAVERINFPADKGADATSLADYFYRGKDGYDVAAFQAVTIGSKVNGALKDMTDKGDITRAFFLHGMSVHLAEALAAYIHSMILAQLRLEPGRGKRYSPGYPLWKDLGDQKKIFRLLDAEKAIGVALTDSFQMVPEQSTTAMVVFNRRAEY